MNKTQSPQTQNRQFRATFATIRQVLILLVILISLMGPIYSAPVQAAPAVWSAYNDCSGTTTGNNTNIACTGTNTGVLKNYATGSNTPVTVTMSTGGSPSTENNGANANSGTDAYQTFNGRANMTGVVNYGDDPGWYVDMRFTGLDPAKTYAFATTANRAGTSSSYTSRVSQFTISDVTAATNASTSGVTAINNESVYFVTGNNTANGYVARWSGIQPGSDGDFTVRVNAYPFDTAKEAYGPSVFMLEEEESTGPTITTTGTLSAFQTAPGTASTAQTYTVSGSNLTGPITINAPSGFQLSTDGSNYSSSLSLTPTGGSVTSITVSVRLFNATSGSFAGNITHTSNGAVTSNVAVTGTVAPCSTIQLVATEDTHMRGGSSRGSYNYGGATTIRVNPYYEQGSTDGQLTGALLKWDLSSAGIPAGASISAASLTFNVTTGSNYAYGLYNMRRAWVEGSNNGATGSGASWNYYGAGTGSWGTEGAQNTSSDRYNTNLWDGTASQFNTTGSVTFDLNASGLAVVQGWADGSLDNYGLTIQNYAGTTTDVWEAASSEATTAANRPRLNATYCFSTGPTATATFQNGTASYTGTVDTFIRGTNDGDMNYSSDTGLEWDDNSNTTTDEIALVRFNNLFTSEGGPIPSGATITSASLTYSTTDLDSSSTALGDPANVYESLVDWPGSTVTWNNFGGEAGVQTNEYNATLVASAPATAKSTAYSINVTASLQRWSNGTPNYGWIFLPTADDGVTIYSSDHATVTYRPLLSVTYVSANVAPNQPVLVQPSDGATSISTSPTLEVTVSDNDPADTLEVSFYEQTGVASGPSGPDFTLVVLPDIQNQSEHAPAITTSQMNWIVNQQSADNIVFLTSVGDLVNTASSTQQYTNADAAFDLLDAASIPYSVGPGNHDMMSSSLFNNYFGVSRFEGKSWYEGHYGSDNYNNYSFFSASGHDFILINLQYSPTPAQMDWADGLLKANPDREGIIVQHDILNTNDSWYNQASYTALRDNPNLFLMLCGHMHTGSDGAAYRAETGTDGHPIHVVMADYQDMSNGNGWLRLLRFSPADEMIYMTTYSPHTGGSITTSPDQMNLAYAATTAGGPGTDTLIGTVSGIANGANASITWSGRAANTEYEWYAVVNDGAASTTGPLWSFTTAAPVNQAPVITQGDNVNVPMSEDGSPNAFNLTLNATDANGDTLTWSIATPPANGTAAASGTGTSQSVSYTPTANYHGSSNFVVQVADGRGGIDTITVNVTVEPVNDVPVCSSTSLTTVEDISGTTSPICTDADSDTLAYTIVGQPTNGSASVVSGLLRYAPNGDFNGSDSFTYQANDGTINSNIVQVAVIVTAANDAPIITQGASTSVTMSEDATPTAFSLPLDATDIDGDTLTWSIATPAAYGTAAASGTGTSKSIGYTPTTDYSGTDSFVVQVTDGHGGTTTITVNVTIEPVNDVPVCSAASLTAAEDDTGTTSPICTDADSDTLIYSIVGQPTNGVASVVSGLLRYVPNGDFNGADSFTYQANDGTIDSNAAQVDVTVTAVNDAPIIAQGASTSVSMSENGSPDPFSLTLDATDVDGDTLTWSIATPASNGTAAASGTGTSKSISYTPIADYTGIDSFVVQVADGQGGMNTITVTVAIAVVNDSPVITQGDIVNVTMSEDGAPAAFSLTLDATDGDGDTLTWGLNIQPSNGTAAISGTGASQSVSYTPTANYYGSDSFVVHVADDLGGYDTIMVNVTIEPVNDVPVCSAAGLTTAEDATGTTSPICTDEDGDTLTYAIVGQPANGSASVISGVLRYAPNGDFNGADNFTYQANDGTIDSNAAQVAVTVTAVNDAPVITQGASTSVTMSENGSPTAFSLALGAADVDGDTLTWSIATPASHGAATASGTGVSTSVGYTPTANYHGADSFVVQVADGQGGSDIITVNVTITLVVTNNAPISVNDSYNTKQGQTLSVPAASGVLANDSDMDGNPLSARLVTAPAKGVLVLNLNGSFTYTPEPNFNGTVTFTYKANDGLDDGNVAQVQIEVKKADLLETPYHMYIPVICR